MATRIKVAVDIRDLRIAKTGVKTYLEELVRVFKTTAPADATFRFFDARVPVYTGRNKFLKLIEHFRFFWWKQIELPVRARLSGCNVIFCADFFVPYFSPGAVTIPVLHDAFFFEYPAHYNKAWLWIFRNIGIPAARRSKFIVTPTAYTASRIAHYTEIEAPKIIAIYEGPKTLRDQSPDAARSIVGKLANERYLLHVGVIEKRKNLLNLLKAFLILREKDDKLHLVLAGQFSPKTDMDDKDSILSFISQNQLQDIVHLPGYVPDNELSAWYKNAAVYVFPSYNEGFGIPVLEAFRFGVPVAIADNSCLPEVTGDAALCFNPSEPAAIAAAVQQLLDDPDLRSVQIARGKARLKRFSWELTGARLIELFRQAVEKNR